MYETGLVDSQQRRESEAAFIAQVATLYQISYIMHHNPQIHTELKLKGMIGRRQILLSTVPARLRYKLIPERTRFLQLAANQNVGVSECLPKVVWRRLEAPSSVDPADVLVRV